MVLKKRRQAGQATFEYILLLIILLSAYIAFVRSLTTFQLGEKMLKPIQEDYKNAYQVGHPKGRSNDEGTSENHPRAEDGGMNSFRLFINPR
ncbi:MAG TPA: hypothetical protein DCS07_14835 [Bdellovibrionales bacterium]|nr:MAG: hypothetical protein A2Z97_16705 [Bdellovibrionales bacterium GWB1_52_6]OFZ03408.1 MAG: hypothetical protein A2X97_05535 [Bdellovibrionales bacterium GWA1_52_35]HAR43886.1 hypothetical protein [Bdellovibrionales bacterium]HCM40990.1 hypothetical protein [Bdellovibrionales bacterium]